VLEAFDRLQAAVAGRYALVPDASGHPVLLGRGGMATVFLADDLRHHRRVALKVLHPELAVVLGPERFRREIEIAARLSHPHILPLYDSGAFDARPGIPGLYYAMPRVVGESLRQRLTREQHLTISDAIRIAREIGDALDYAHREGVIHRDIKPENILLDGYPLPPEQRDGWHALVTDFGIARAIAGSVDAGTAEKLTETGFSVGTPAYMSPEQAAGGRDLDARSDLYSLGCVVYEMLAGEPPFSGHSARVILARHALDPVPPLRTVRVAVPEHVEQAVLRALGKVPADRFATAGEFVAALEGRDTAPTMLRLPGATTRRRRLPGRAVPLGIGAAAVFAAGAGVLLSRRAAPAELDPNLLAVAPFDVPDARLALWREGLVDYLTKSLDGAGQLRTVAPGLVIREWKGRADPASARALGRRSGARIVVYGNLSPAGRDSVRVRATTLDALSGTPVAEFEGFEAVDRVDRLADSLTIELLRGLGRMTTGGEARAGAVGTRSIPALKAYLKGRHYARQGAGDSARAQYSRAVALDTTFALALHALATIRGWDSDFQTFLRAGRFNRGLSPRDSLLILVDSLRAAASEFDTAYWSHRVRMLEIAQGNSNDNADDPETTRVFAELLYHHYDVVGSTWFGKEAPPIDVRRAFDRAIELDSSSPEPYVHPIELAGDPVRARPYIQGHLQAAGPERASAGIRLLARLIDPARTPVEPLDSASTGDLNEVLALTRAWRDSAELALRVVRVYVARPDVAEGPDVPEVREPWRRGFQRQYPAELLAYRGHLEEARRLMGPNVSRTFVDLALMGAIPADTAAALVAAWDREPRYGFEEVPRFWWAARRDTVRLLARLAAEEKAARTPTGLPPDMAETLAAPALTRALLALARADTAEALRRMLALPDSVFARQWGVRLLKFRLLVAAGRDAEAGAVFDGVLRTPTSPLWVLGRLERARVGERRSQRESDLGARQVELARAADSYRFVAEVWRHADPELAPYVAEAKAGLARLGETVGTP
jgi:serine/threonine-protein kinase